jgi:hypothetical protein
LSTKVVDLGVHPSKEEFGQDLLTLSSDLDAHVLDFGTDVI